MTSPWKAKESCLSRYAFTSSCPASGRLPLTLYLLFVVPSFASPAPRVSFARMCGKIVAISLEAFAFSPFIPLYPFLEFHGTFRKEPTLAPFPPPFRPCRAAPARCTMIARQWAYFDTDTRPYRYPSVDEVAPAVISSRYLSTSHIGSLDRRCPTGKPASVVARALAQRPIAFLPPIPCSMSTVYPALAWRGSAATAALLHHSVAWFPGTESCLKAGGSASLRPGESTA